MEDKLVSVILPFFNRRDLLKSAIDSVLAQTYSNFELILVDDGSNCRVDDFLEKIVDQRIVYVRLDENQGASHARNVGIDMSRGEYIAFLDSDNIWNEHYLSQRIGAIEENNLDFAFGRYCLWEENGDAIVWPNVSVEYVNNFCEMQRYIFKENVFDTNAIVLKRSTIDRIGRFDETLKRFQDWDYFGRLFQLEGVRYLFLEDELVNGYIQENSISKQNAFWDNRFVLIEKNAQLIDSFGMRAEIIEYLFEKSKYYPLNAGDRYRLLSLIDMNTLSGLMTMSIQRKEELELKRSENAFFKEKIGRMEKDADCLRKNKVWRFDYKDIGNAKRIIVYGYGDMGHDYVSQILESDELQLVGVIDKNHSVGIEDGINFYTLEDINNLVYDIILIAILNKKVADEVMNSIKINPQKILWAAKVFTYE